MTRTAPRKELLAKALTALLPLTPISPLTASLIDAAIQTRLPPLNLYRVAFLLLLPKRVGKFINMISRQRASTFADALSVAETVYFIFLLNGGLLEVAARAAVRPLERRGVWDEFRARLVTHRDQAQIEMFALAQFAQVDAIVAAALIAGHLPDDPDFCEEWENYLDRYGHRAANEIDLAAPRLHESPQTLIAAITAFQTRAKRRHTLTGWLNLAHGLIAGGLVRRREQFEYHAAFAFAHLRKQFLKLARAAVERGQIESPEAIWQMDQDALRALDPAD